MSRATTVDLLRHGEPVGGRRYRGQQDDPLSDRGWAQMRAAIGVHCPWQAVVTSPLERCAAFARSLARSRNLPLEVDERLMELGFGAWEGHTADALEWDEPGRVARFLADPLNNTPPGAETLPAFRERVIGAWQELIVRHAGRQVLVVAHAGVMRMIVREVLDMPLERMFRIVVPNAGITRIRLTADDQGRTLPSLVFHAGQL